MRSGVVHGNDRSDYWSTRGRKFCPLFVYSAYCCSQKCIDRWIETISCLFLTDKHAEIFGLRGDKIAEVCFVIVRLICSLLHRRYNLPFQIVTTGYSLPLISIGWLVNSSGFIIICFPTEFATQQSDTSCR